MYRSYFILLLLFVNTKISSQLDSVKLFYEIDHHSLSSIHQNNIQSAFDSLVHVKLNIRIRGSADFLGNEKANQLLSDKRVYTVGEYISQNFGSVVDKIIYDSEGEKKLPTGQKEDTKLGVPAHRMVTIYFEEAKTADTFESLVHLEKGEQIILENLNFQPGRHVLLDEAVPTLKKLLKTLQDYPDLRIEIHGHICCFHNQSMPDGLDIDTREYKLSLNRAINIYNYLVRNGIDTSRLAYKGFGFSTPLIFPEETSEDKTRNRRVELKRM